MSEQAIIVAEPGTPEWTAARLTGIGSSEIAAAAGLSRYGTPFEIYCRKRGLLAETPDNDAMRLGRRLEPIVKAEFTDRTGLALSQPTMPMLRHPKHGEIIDTPDGLVIDGNPLEAKTTSWRMAKELGEEGSDHVPAEWLCQVQWHMLVTNAPLAHLAVLIDGRTLRTYTIPRNQRLLDLLIAAAVELWARITNEDPPEPNWEAPGTPDLIREIHGVDESKVIVLPEHLVELWQEQRELAATETYAKRERDILRAKIAHAMGDAARGAIPGVDFEIIRKQCNRKGYTVEPKSYVTLSERKL